MQSKELIYSSLQHLTLPRTLSLVSSCYESRARCFIQCMLMYRKDPLSLDPLAPLTAANLPRCLESVVSIRELIPGLFPDGMTNERAARILGTLNTNSHEVL